MDDRRKKIVDRIKALRAKADDVAATEAEALAAAEAAAKLLMKHEVTADELRETKDAEGISHGFRSGKELHPVLGILWQGISRLTETEAYNDSGELRFIGVESDVMMAVYLSEMLVAAAKRAFLDFAEGYAGNFKAYKALRHGYFQGFADVVNRRLHELAFERSRERSAQNQSESTALVVVKKDIIKRVKEEMGLNLVKGKARRAKPLNEHAYRKGRAQGEKVNLNRPMGEAASNERIA